MLRNRRKNVTIDDSIEEEDSSEEVEEIISSDNSVIIENEYSDCDIVPIEEPQPKRFKASEDKKDYFKPPTAEELNRLKETENLFNSSLFRLQTDQLLKEVKVNEKRVEKLDKWLEGFTNLLQNLPESKQYSLDDKKLLKRLKTPPINLPFPTKGIFKFAPPTVHTVGSYSIGLSYDLISVDLQLEIPKECWQHKDYLNATYFHKRALYLAHLANLIAQHESVDRVYYKYQHCDELRPILCVIPAGKLAKKCEIILLPVPPTGFFKLNRFEPIKANVRASCIFPDTEDVPTPHYNHAIMKDLACQEHKETIEGKLQDATGCRDGVVLLKIWLQKRKIDQGFSSFSRFMMTMLVAHLIHIKKISKMMSSYQVIRTVFITLAEAEWSSNGIKFGQVGSQAELNIFHNLFDVVFVDESNNNICGNVSLSTFDRLKHEAKLGLQWLQFSSSDGFDSLFVKPVQFGLCYDITFKIAKFPNEISPHNSVIDYCGHRTPSIMPKIISIIKQGLGDRALLIESMGSSSPQWEISQSCPQEYSQPKTIGFILNLDNANNLLDKGPEANDPQALSFRSFWGDRSELRRFQDGTIREAVVWTAANLNERRKIVLNIVKYVLKKHFGINRLIKDRSEIESILEIPALKFEDKNVSYGTGDESLLLINQTYNSLSKQLRNLNDLPLAITSIQGISPALRYTEVSVPIASSFNEPYDTARYIFEAPPFVYPIEVVLHMEGSGKWPDDLEALKRVKVAFLIKIGQLLKLQCFLSTSINTTHVDVMKDGYVFRLFLASRKELTLMRQFLTSDGKLKTTETEQSLDLECRFELLPQLSGSLQGLHQQHSVYSPACRLAKRWIAAQMLSRHIPQICVELIVAQLFLSPAPFSIPGSPAVALLRFLALLSETNWQTTPFIVNLNDTFKAEEITEIQSWFTANRPTLPALCIVTPYDKNNRSIWSRKSPTGPILYHLIRLAKSSMSICQEQMAAKENDSLKSIFKPPMDLYDVRIYLNTNQIPKLLCSVDRPLSANSITVKPYSKSRSESIPFIDYDPVTCYLRELEESYGHIALFCYDTYGGECIGVIWKPNAFTSKPFKIGDINGQKLTKDGHMVSNLEAVLEGFGIIGTGLVFEIKTKIK